MKALVLTVLAALVSPVAFAGGPTLECELTLRPRRELAPEKVRMVQAKLTENQPLELKLGTVKFTASLKEIRPVHAAGAGAGSDPFNGPAPYGLDLTLEESRTDAATFNRYYDFDTTGSGIFLQIGKLDIEGSCYEQH